MGSRTARRIRRQRHDPVRGSGCTKPAHWLARIDTETGSMSLLPVSDPKSARHYIDLHRQVPENIRFWPKERIRALVNGLATTQDRGPWEYALIMLAHHGSRLALELLHALRPGLPREVEGIWNQAWAEAQVELAGA